MAAAFRNELAVVEWAIKLAGASADAAQHHLTNVAGPFDIRVYQVRLVLKAEPTNVLPIESGNTTAYPYYSA